MNNKEIKWALVILVVFIYVLTYPSMIYDYNRADEYTGTTTGTITNVKIRKKYVGTQHRYRDWYYYTIEYKVNGRTYRYSKDSMTSVTEGHTFTLYYDPDDPHSVKSVTEYKHSKSLGFLLFKMLAPPVVIALIAFSRRNE